MSDYLGGGLGFTEKLTRNRRGMEQLWTVDMYLLSCSPRHAAVYADIE